MNRRNFFSQVLSKKPTSFFTFSYSHCTVQPLYPLYNLSTCVASLQACANDENLTRGQQIHSYMLTNDFLNSPFSVTSLISMYSKCNRMDYAISIFNSSSHECNVFAYNTIIAGFIANGLAGNGFEFYKQMRVVGVMADKFTFPCGMI